MKNTIAVHTVFARAAILLTFILSVTVSGQSLDSLSLERFLNSNLSVHPKSEIRDIYKLLYQGEFGVGHLIKSREMAGEYLRTELGKMSRFEGEPLTESCSVTGNMIRVNLRPFVALNLSTDSLLGLMMETASQVHGDKQRFADQWQSLRLLIEKGALPFGLKEFDEFTDTMKANGYPLVHHSEIYSEAYKPAYRVVLKSAYDRVFLEETMKK